MNVGIIGLGHGSRVLIDSFILSKIKIYGITSKNYENALKIGKKRKIKKIYRHWMQLINDKNIHVVAIAVPPVFQIKMVKECILQKKIIFCEKPLGISIYSIRRIFFSLSNYSKHFTMNYMFQEHEAFRVYKNLIKKYNTNNLGSAEVKFYTQTYVNKNKLINWKSDSSKGGGVINLFFSHIIDYLITFFGEIIKIKVEISNNSKTKLHAIIEFKSMIKASIHIDSNCKNNLHSIKYLSKNNELVLKNKGADYCKNFKIYNNFRNKKKNIYVEVPYKNNIKNFKKDTRIYYTSKVINRLKKPYNDYENKINLKRLYYNEKILNLARLSGKNQK